MDAPARQVAKRAVDHTLPFEPRDTGKSLCLDVDREMRFARAIVARMAMMPGAVIDDRKPSG